VVRRLGCEKSISTTGAAVQRDAHLSHMIDVSARAFVCVPELHTMKSIKILARTTLSHCARLVHAHRDITDYYRYARISNYISVR
jgi:hypothetical protein